MNRMKNIDILKSVCAFLVVCIHVPFPGATGSVITALARIAVPIFFMISGYYYADIVKKGTQYNQIKKIAILTINANLIFLIWTYISAVFKNESLHSLTTSLFTTKNLLKFLFLNDSPFAEHLWYLSAFLCVLLIVLIADKAKCRKVLYCLIPFLLIGDLLLGNYSLVIFKFQLPLTIVRNFCFVGIPYFCLGCLLRKHHTRLKNISNYVLISAIVFFSATTIFEKGVLNSMHIISPREHYLSTTFLAIALFIYAIKVPFKGSFVTNIAALIGKKYSTWLYIIHPIIIACLAKIVQCEEIYSWVAPIIVYILTVAFLHIIELVKRFFIKKRLS